MTAKALSLALVFVAGGLSWAGEAPAADSVLDDLGARPHPKPDCDNKAQLKEHEEYCFCRAQAGSTSASQGRKDFCFNVDQYYDGQPGPASCYFAEWRYQRDWKRWEERIDSIKEPQAAAGLKKLEAENDDAAATCLLALQVVPVRDHPTVLVVPPDDRRFAEQYPGHLEIFRKQRERIQQALDRVVRDTKSRP